MLLALDPNLLLKLVELKAVVPYYRLSAGPNLVVTTLGIDPMKHFLIRA